jgi:hypothetical protein
LVYYQQAVCALVEVLLDFQFHGGVEVAVDVVGDFEDYAIAVQLGFLSRM